jgi:putative transcriptional regulator
MHCGKGISMKQELFDELLGSVRQGAKIIRGKRKVSRCFNWSDPNVPQIRKSYGLSQKKFASLLGISLATLRNWEQGRRKPEGAARVLLFVAAKHPEAVLDSVREVPIKKMA